MPRDVAHSEKYKDHEIVIDYDPEPMNPRTEYDNFSKMVCFHKRYTLGDKTDLRCDDFSGWEALEAHLISSCDAEIVMPLYLYDHSGLTISTNQFSCKWDSGRVGVVYATHDSILDMFGEGPEAEGKARKLILAEVETYDHYLQGHSYGFIVKKDDEELHTCWGYTGDYNEAIEEAKRYIDYRISGLSYKKMTETEKLEKLLRVFTLVMDGLSKEDLIRFTGLPDDIVQEILDTYVAATS